MSNIKKITRFLIVPMLFLSTGNVFAASISFETETPRISQNSDVIVTVFINTDGNSLNAVQGKIIFSPDMFQVKEIRDGGSSVNFWVDKPHVTDPGVIVFSGITPGGFSRSKEVLFSVVYTTKDAGNGYVTARDLHILKNDGNGTEVVSTVSDLTVSVTAGEKGEQIESLTDVVPPEDFKPYVGNDAFIFSGKNFLVFSAQDKGSGIDHYEVKEGFWGSYIKAESPYLLQNQSLGTKIYVKAIDRSGNERVVSFSSSNTLSVYKLLIILGIMLIVCFFLIKKLWGRSAR
jgi:hypothetical protein